MSGKTSYQWEENAARDSCYGGIISYEPFYRETDDPEDETYGDAHITLLAGYSDEEFDRGSND